MNLNIYHKNHEMATKKWLRGEYSSDSTDPVVYVDAHHTDYEREVHTLGAHVLNYIILTKDHRTASQYCQTNSIDWE